jgi:hypothetical protein
MWLLCRGGDLSKADLAEPDPDEVDPAVLILAIPLSLTARLRWVLFGRIEDLALMGGLPLVGIVPRMCDCAAHSLQAPLFPLSLTLGQSHAGVPTSADRAFWGFWDRLGAFYAALRELFEP